MTELSQETKALIARVSKLDDPTLDDRERIKQRLLVQVGTAAFVTGAVATSSQLGHGSLAAAKTGLFGGTMGKVMLCAGALCAVGGALLLDWPLDTSARKHAESAKSAISAPHVEQPKHDVLARAESTAVQSETPSVMAEAESAPKSAEVGARARHKRAKAVEEPVASVEPSTLAEELSLLSQAQAALRAGQQARALSLANEHAARFPRGVMSEERMGVAALAQCELAKGQPEEAHRQQARRFLELAARSPLAARVRKACGLE